MKKQHIKLSDQDRDQLLEMLQKGSLKSRTYKRIMALLELDKGQTYTAVQGLVKLSRRSLGKLPKRYQAEGLGCLYDAPRPGRPVKIDQGQKDKLTVLSCSDAPEGHSQWSLRLLADKMVELGHCDSISHTQVGTILKKAYQAAPD
jgi:transposase